MPVLYEVWDTCSGDLAGTFATEEAALGVVRDAVARYNATYAEYFLLVEADDAQGSRRVAEGKALVILALATGDRGP